MAKTNEKSDQGGQKKAAVSIKILRKRSRAPAYLTPILRKAPHKGLVSETGRYAAEEGNGHA